MIVIYYHFNIPTEGPFCCADTQLKQSVVSIKYEENMLVDTQDIRNIVNKLKCGKSAGPNGISTESLEFSHSRLYVLLSICLSLCLAHGYV